MRRRCGKWLLQTLLAAEEIRGQTLWLMNRGLICTNNGNMFMQIFVHTVAELLVAMLYSVSRLIGIHWD